MAGLAARVSAFSGENVLVVVPFLFDTFLWGGKEKVYCKHLSDINKMDYHSALANHVITSDPNFGIYITDGTQMNDFGGPGGHPLNYTPCGNGWPVNTDPLISPGYPNTAEDPITGLLDIFQWTPPSNWYSIFDENASSDTDVMGYTYHAFDNEHVGDFEDVVDWPDDAVWPTSIIWRRNDNQNPLRGDENTCSTQPEIHFPSARTVAQTVNSLKEQELAIHPNPFSDELIISVHNSSLNIERIQILDLSGKVMMAMEEHFSGETIRFNTSQLKSGVYLLQAISVNGEISNYKLIRQ